MTALPRFHHIDRHTRDQMNFTDCRRHGVKQQTVCEKVTDLRAFGILDTHEILHNGNGQVSEPTAEHHAEDCAGHAAPCEHGKHPPHSGLGVEQLDPRDTAEGQKQTVADIREHHTEDHKVEDRHYEGRIERAVFRVGIHSDDPFEVLRKPVVTKQNRRIFSRLRLVRFVGALEFAENRRDRILHVLGEPSLQNRAGFGCRQFLLQFRHAQSRCFHIVKNFDLVQSLRAVAQTLFPSDRLFFQFRQTPLGLT